ncbi:MAG: hypothetical protein NT007_07205 [Candidatus Kapabacteria bacterium]|nr:hypothetical protein [Candidatus Kapabacteria bacterium]
MSFPRMRVCENYLFLSFLRMLESPDSCIRTNDSLQVGNDISYDLIIKSHEKFI